MATFATQPSPFDFPLFAEYPCSPPTSGTLMDGDFDQSMALFDPPTYQDSFTNGLESHASSGLNLCNDQNIYRKGSQNPSYGSESTESVTSSSSSALTPPSANLANPHPQIHGPWPASNSGSAADFDLGVLDTSAFDFANLLAGEKYNGLVDPSLIQPLPTPTASTPTNYPQQQQTPSFQPTPFPQPPSPAFSNHSTQGSNKLKSYRSQSPYMHTSQWQPYPQKEESRRGSIHSMSSRYSHPSPRSASIELDEEGREKQRCPFPECGRMFKDLKAHMLTHQTERPEKCPIVSCEYHSKGFARKYDKNRHTLTHYKGTMVCGFCPGSGSPAEKSFNRADVFKRHLTSVHGVEQNPPNGRKKSPSAKKSVNHAQDATGKCSTCGSTFATAQDLYEHLDDCVLRVVQQEDPSEAINKQLLESVAEDENVKNTMERHLLTEGYDNNYSNEDEDDDEEEADSAEGESTNGSRSARTGVLSHVGGGNISKNNTAPSGGKSQRVGGITYSKGGVALVSKGRKRRKNYPLSWGCSADKMKMKKRVLCVFDGPRRLVKDDMMLGNEFEVRMKLDDGESYVTDLDVETMRRANGFHGSTQEERGPWIADNDYNGFGELVV